MCSQKYNVKSEVPTQHAWRWSGLANERVCTTHDSSSRDNRRFRSYSCTCCRRMGCSSACQAAGRRPGRGRLRRRTGSGRRCACNCTIPKNLYPLDFHFLLLYSNKIDFHWLKQITWSPTKVRNNNEKRQKDLRKGDEKELTVGQPLIFWSVKPVVEVRWSRHVVGKSAERSMKSYTHCCEKFSVKSLLECYFKKGFAKNNKKWRKCSTSKLNRWTKYECNLPLFGA